MDHELFVEDSSSDAINTLPIESRKVFEYQSKTDLLH